jgi:hypothetical protein
MVGKHLYQRKLFEYYSTLLSNINIIHSPGWYDEG